MIRTKRGAIRRYNAIIRQCWRDGKGGLKFGLDFPTLAVIWPDRYQELRHIRSIYNQLPN